MARRRVIAVKLPQTGASNVSVDRRYRALAPGKRRSKRGKTYYETRKNRSDRPGTRV